MNIQELQDKLVAYYVQGCPDEQEIYLMLGFAEWSDYHAMYSNIWTPELRYRLYMLSNPQSTLEQAFIAGVKAGWFDGFNLGYDAALEDLDGGMVV